MMVKGLIAAMLMTSTAEAACCVQRVVVKRVVQQVIPVVPVQTLFLVAPPSYYGAAKYSPPAARPAPVKSTSLDEQIIAQLERIAAALANLEARMDRLEHGGNDVIPVDDVVPVDDPPPEPVPAAPLVIHENCGKCHIGQEAKGDFDLSMLTIESRNLMARAMVANGKMPIDADGHPVTITRELRSQLLHALEGIER